MTWKSHIAIAVAISLPFSASAVSLAALGAIAPDMSEYILNFLGIRVKHREATHYLIVPIALLAISLYFPILLWFAIGYLSHWCADALTVSGVPVAPNSAYRVHFFGGSIRTGDTAEYIIAFSLLAASLLIARPLTSSAEKFNQYNMNYKKLYDEEIIDAQELHDYRFKFF